MDDLVNRLKFIEREVKGSGATFELKGREIIVRCPDEEKHFEVHRLYRPSTQEIIDTASPESILVLSNISDMAAKVARTYNHIEVPTGSYRIIAPGIAVQNNLREKKAERRKIRLQGTSGTVVESMLMENRPDWSVLDLARTSGASTALVHRILERLETETIVEAQGTGRFKSRRLTNRQALAELWSQEEKPPKKVTRAYLYKADTEEFIPTLLSKFTTIALAGVHAANGYKPFLTRINSPAKVWIPYDFDLYNIRSYGIDQVDEGHNIELMQTPDDPWLRWTREKRISPWRAWMEVSTATGRTRELSDILIKDLLNDHN